MYKSMVEDGLENVGYVVNYGCRFRVEHSRDLVTYTVSGEGKRDGDM